MPTGSVDRKLTENFQNPKKRHLSNPKSGPDIGPEGSMVSLIQNAFLSLSLRFMKLLQNYVTYVTRDMLLLSQMSQNAFEPVS